MIHFVGRDIVHCAGRQRHAMCKNNLKADVHYLFNRPVTYQYNVTCDCLVGAVRVIPIVQSRRLLRVASPFIPLPVVLSCRLSA